MKKGIMPGDYGKQKKEVRVPSVRKLNMRSRRSIEASLNRDDELIWIGSSKTSWLRELRKGWLGVAVCGAISIISLVIGHDAGIPLDEKLIAATSAPLILSLLFFYCIYLWKKNRIYAISYNHFIIVDRAFRTTASWYFAANFGDIHIKTEEPDSIFFTWRHNPIKGQRHLALVFPVDFEDIENADTVLELMRAVNDKQGPHHKVASLSARLSQRNAAEC